MIDEFYVICQCTFSRFHMEYMFHDWLFINENLLCAFTVKAEMDIVRIYSRFKRIYPI